ncbi:hypothetical protein MYCO108962_06615 [Mycobacterium colombiense]|uniref:Scaffolding protein n=1 Tax=Mycobacterium colombiense CECT 3035 TaxID=1041522 RepID=J4TDD2_9MYCO|nr:hypothetical protein [Mycobacterium colombiense]EJO86753.1 hypothetical protein MCOL_V222628 [Mycobacterium colombiense CECT 3035]
MTTEAATAAESTAPPPTSTDTVENPTAGPDTPEERENGIPADDGEQDSRPRGRAAVYRERAQAAEARASELEQQIAGHAATIERLQRLHVDAAIERAGVKPAAVHAITDLAGLLGDDGLPDPAKITEAVNTAKETLGIQRPTVNRQMGMRSGAGVSPPRKDNWAAAFAPRDE